MHTPHIRRFGLAKSRANVLNGQGYGFHAMIPLNQHRPALQEDYIASPIRDEGVTVYSFKNAEARESFIESYGGERLP